MSDVAIRVEGLSKQYKLGATIQHDRLKDLLTQGLNRVFSRNPKSAIRNPQSEYIWALKDISFEVKEGETLGIIGANGAGKSTLLKILSRITEPTSGRAEIYGRVGSLLEVGTGFDRELTGRENIYLNGAILGMTKREIDRRFDEIVDFSGVEKFIDTPVKRYSSGMYVRLAFAVAAHLEPEILIVDEVLAVGDAAFQKKCLGKMEIVAKEGRTVLFVSHNLASVQNLCNRGILLSDGRISTNTTAADTIATYLKTIERGAWQKIKERTDRRGKGQLRITEVEISTGGDSPSTTLSTGRPARFLFHLNKTAPGTSCKFTIYDQQGQAIANYNSALHGPEDSKDTGIGPTIVCDIDELLLVPGRYRINVGIYEPGGLQDHVEGAAFFDVAQGTLRGRPVLINNGYGSVAMHHRWKLPSNL